MPSPKPHNVRRAFITAETIMSAKSMTAQYDAIIIGTGQAGPSLAARLANAGRKVAIVERKLFGGHMREHRLHSDQDDGRERLRGPHGPAGG